jgi:hypothetical protein
VTATDGATPAINNTGIILYSIWEEERRTYHAVWHNTKRAFRLTDSGEWGLVHSINDLGEAVFSLGYQLPELLYLLKREATPGDTDDDTDVDLRDYSALLGCIGRPAGIDCTSYDLDLDDRVTAQDAQLLVLSMSGPY